MSTSSPRPASFHTVTPYLFIAGAEKAIDFYKAAFGAETLSIMNSPGNESRIMHGEIKIGDSILFISDPVGQSGEACTSTSQSSFYLYVNDVDATYKQAVASGATSKMSPVDMFWGDRMGNVIDPYGQNWSIATKVKDVTPEQMKQAQEEFFKKQPPAEKK